MDNFASGAFVEYPEVHIQHVKMVGLPLFVSTQNKVVSHQGFGNSYKIIADYWG